MNRLMIIGAGGHGAVVGEAAVASDTWSEIAYFDDDSGLSSVVGLPILGKVTDLWDLVDDDVEVFVAIGDNRIRLSLCDEIENRGVGLATIIHPNAIISPSCRIGKGSVVCAGTVVNARAELGRGCIVNTGATVDHDCCIADGVHISPGANLAGEVSVGNCSWVGIGAAVREGSIIGSDAIVGAGAAVVSDVGNGETVVGVPAMSIAT